MKPFRLPRNVFFLLLGLVLVLVLIFMFQIRDFVRQAILIPLAYVYWVIDLLVKSTPQGIFWAVMVVIALFIALKSLAAVSRDRPMPNGLEERYVHRERVGFWALQLQLARAGYTRGRFAELFSRLIVDVLAFSDQVPSYIVEQRLESDHGDIPAEVCAFFQIRRGFMIPKHLSLRARLEQWLKRVMYLLMDRRRMDYHASSSLDLDKALSYLEGELGIDHEHRYR